MANLDSVLKSRVINFTDKDPSSPNYDFSSSHVWMWDLDHKESWAPKNWCFQTVMLAKTLESLLDRKEIKPVNPKGNQSWILIGRTNAEDEAPKLWPPDAKTNSLEKTLMLGKIEDRRRRGQQRQRWLDGITDSKTWVWANSGTEWRTGKPGVLQSMGSQRVGHNLVTEQQPQRHIHVRNYTDIHICALLLFSQKYGILLPKFFIQLCITIIFPCL